MHEQPHASYPEYADHAADYVVAVERPFFLIAPVPPPELKGKPKAFAREIPRLWAKGEERLARMAYHPVNAQPFHTLLDRARRKVHLTYEEISRSFPPGYCTADDVKSARTALNAGLETKQKRSNTTKWEFKEVEMAQLLVAVVIKRKFLDNHDEDPER